MIDLTLDGFMIGNMPAFHNEFGTKKTGTNQDGSPKGCNTLELTVNMMLPFLRKRPVTVTSNQETSSVEADASIILSGETTSFRLGPGAYHGVEVKLCNETQGRIELLDADFIIPMESGDTLELRWNGSDWRVKTMHFVGDMHEQMPLTRSPLERRWEGHWVNWTYRPTFMGLRTTAPSSGFLSDWHNKRHDIWDLNTDGTTATQGTKKYGKTGGGIPDGHIILPREAVIKLQDPDLTEGDQITTGPYTGYYVWQNIALAGTYRALADDDPAYQGGGYRPPFNQGVAPDVMRQIKASLLPGFIRTTNDSVISGAFDYLIGNYVDIGYANRTANPITGIDSSLVVSTGPQNAPVTASCILWRRTG